MSRSSTRPRNRLAVAFAAAIALLPLTVYPAAAATTPLLPDMRMGEPFDLQVQRTSADRYKLRFATIVWNVGDGPLEARANTRSGNVMTNVFQVIHRANGTRRNRSVEAAVFYSGDGHDHWHIGRFVVVTLGPVPGAPPQDPPITARTLRKIGFCLIDTTRAPAGELRPPNSATSARYPYSGCGVRNSTSVRMGISVGFGDVYQAFFAHQSVDVTGLNAGTYRLCATTNGELTWRERADNLTNNSYWYDIQLDPAARTVSVVANGLSACDTPPPPPPPPPSPSA